MVTMVELSEIRTSESPHISLAEWMQNPPEDMEWVNGKLLEKSGMTLKHGEVQLNLGSAWRTYSHSSSQGGKVYTEAPCRTNLQGRKPDVAYLTQDLFEQFGELAVLPQSFPLVAEIVSPTDFAQDVIAKAQEYLQAGCLEVWLVFPENRWIIIITQDQQLVFTTGVISTQTVLLGFSMTLSELFD